MALAITLGVAALFAAAFLLGQRVLLSLSWKRSINFPDHPPPDHWSDIVKKNFKAAVHLPRRDFDHLLRLSQVFIRDRHFEGAQGFEVTEEVQVTIAAQACYLLLGTGLSVYPRTRSVIVYPSTFVPRRVGESADGLIDGLIDESEATPTLGEAWSTGTVILAWDNLLGGGMRPHDGKNLAFHEFAHQLDQDSGEMSGTPGGLPPTSISPWARVLSEGYTRLRRSAAKGRREVLDHYGATNRAEFFAVSTEAFFEQPQRLRQSFPALYEQLAIFYGQDPATGPGTHSHPISESG